MEQKMIEKRIKKHRAYFNSHKTLDYAFRYAMLGRFKQAMLSHKEDIFTALYSDLNKSRYEAHMTEYALVMHEIDYAMKHLKSWMKPKREGVSLVQMPSSSKCYHDPYGVVLVMSPWNYPLLLTLSPVIGAIAAGNCVVIKPSAYSPETSAVIQKIMEMAFDKAFVSVVTGGRAENQSLLQQAFDYIFFTGSPSVGKIVLEHAAPNLTPVTLELGGKSPCIVDKYTDLGKTAKRLLFGKLLNSGQTCVAPDYLFVHEDIKEKFVEVLIKQHKKMLNDIAYKHSYFPKIINEKHFNRLIGYFEDQDIIYGGTYDKHTRQIDLTLIDNPDPMSPVMQEEIFGPILPIITWKKMTEVAKFINNRPKPLALYLFTKRRHVQNFFMTYTTYGGGCVNDTIMHLSSVHQPFGGVGNSGMGSYHGKKSFETFSHDKSVLKKSWYFDLPVRYHPYKNANGNLPEFLFK